MVRALAVGFGLATAFATVMFACGGDDSGGGGTAGSGTAGTGSGTAGSGSGTAGSATGAGGGAGTSSGVGGAVDFDAASIDFDALFGNGTCADLTACCATITDAMVKAQCDMVVGIKNDQVCSAALQGFKDNNYCN